VKKKSVVIGSITAGLIVVALTTSYSLLAFKNETALTFSNEVVKRRDIASAIQATGVIRAKVGAEVKVGSRISGRVEKLFANIGDVVDKGQIVAKLEQQDLSAKVNETKMGLKIAEANLAFAEKNYDRMKNLYAKDFVSRDKVDLAERDLKAIKAQVEQAKAILQFSETQKSYATITSPISGVVTAVTAQEGETISVTPANAPTFMNIVDLKRLEVYVNVDETDIGKIKPGLEATFTVDSYPDTSFKGVVTSIYPKATIQDNVVYYITTISIENQDGKLKPDLTANASIYLNKRSGVIAVPTKAIKRDGGKKIVYMLENNMSVPRLVKTGWKDASYTEVLEGIKEGERVIVGEPPLTKSDNK